MEIRLLDFTLGGFFGLMLGLALAWFLGRLRAWLGRSEAARLARENRELKRRLAEKDKHIGRMLAETQRLAETLARDKTAEESAALSR